MRTAGLMNALKSRDTTEEAWLKLLQNPFSAQLSSQSIWAALGTSIGFTAFIAIAFCLLRPYNSVVYAPKLKHADEAHTPPPMGKGIFAWFKPVVTTNEQELVRLLGLDATVFLRFTRMCRNIFLVVTVLGCGILIPINLSLGQSKKFKDVAFIQTLTAINTFGEAIWGQVAVAWMINIIVAGFLFWNYRKILQLRRQYYNCAEYQNSLHARTLMINDIPKQFRSDEGIGILIDEVVPTSSFSRTAIARNVKDLPKLIEEHGKTVRQLEKYLAKYLKNPDNLPASRPTCKPSKADPSYPSYSKGQMVDAIEYLGGRIRELEGEIKDVRASVDKRNAMSYGFASYSEIAEAHSIAYACRNKHPQGTTIVLAPRPNDVIWKNMPLDKSTRRWKRIVNNLWVALLTILWIAPNAAISMLLINLGNLGIVWHDFQISLENHTTWWAIVQGVASPAITSIVFLLLPILFRRMAIRAGDRTKTARERHVTAKLYTFFVFNNLIVFSAFNAIWQYVTAIISKTGNGGTDAWQAIKEADLARLLFIALCNISPFWITWLLQRNLGSAIDLAQLWTLLWTFFVKKLSSPTPREMIELTAPPAFDFASYYNYFLFYATVTLCYAPIQPLVLPAAALYFVIDVYLKKYLLLYIFVTKTESGGMFWRILFNRMVFAVILSNLIVFLVVWVQGDAAHMQAYSVVPLPFLMIGFKIWCRRAFDHKIHYYTVQNIHTEDGLASGKASTKKSDRLSSRYGHPALYKPLITPMVHARAQNVLASIYGGRLTDSNNPETGDVGSMSGYSDTYRLDDMKAGQPGAASMNKQLIPGFEVVPENQLDFSYYKNRYEFGDEHGAGEIYAGYQDPIDRPGTSNTYRSGYSDGTNSRGGTPPPPVPTLPMRGRQKSGMSSSDGVGHVYPPGYISPNPYEEQAVHSDMGVHGVFSSDDRGDSPSRARLVRHAAAPGYRRPSGSYSESDYTSPSATYTAPFTATQREHSLERRPLPPGALGGGPGGYGGLPQHEVEEQPFVSREQDEQMSYDYYRGGGATGSVRKNAGWQGWTG